MKLIENSKEIESLMLKSVLEQIEEGNTLAEMEVDFTADSIIEIEITEEESSSLALSDEGNWYWKRPDAA